MSTAQKNLDQRLNMWMILSLSNVLFINITALNRICLALSDRACLNGKGIGRVFIVYKTLFWR